MKNTNYKFIDSTNVINVPENATDVLNSTISITTEEDKQNLIDHIYIPKNKALLIDDFVFINRPFSLFHQFNNVSNVKTVTVNKVKENTKPWPLDIISYNEKKITNTENWLKKIKKYFTPLIYRLQEDDVLFHGVIKLKWIFKNKSDDDEDEDSEVVVESTVANAYLLSLILDENKKVINKDNISNFVKYTPKKLVSLLQKKKEDYGTLVELILKNKFKSGEEINEIEWTNLIRNYVQHNKKMEGNKSGFKKYLSLVNITELKSKYFVFNKMEVELFKMLVEVE